MEGHSNLSFYDCPEKLFASDCKAGLLFSHGRIVPAKKAGHFLCIHPRDLAAGIGCNRGVTARDMQATVEKLFKKMKLPLAALHSINTIAAKKDEQGLLRFARDNGLLLRFYLLRS